MICLASIILPLVIIAANVMSLLRFRDQYTTLLIWKRYTEFGHLKKNELHYLHRTSLPSAKVFTHEQVIKGTNSNHTNQFSQNLSAH